MIAATPLNELHRRACGKSEQAARAWALGPDQRNAELIATTRSRGDLIVTLDDPARFAADGIGKDRG